MKIEAVFEDIFEEVIPLITGPQNAAHAAVSRELFLGLANDVHAHAPHHRKVFGGVFCADTAGVFPEGDIEYPVVLILDAPVASHDLGDALCLWR
jgi:hypothetical protein